MTYAIVLVENLEFVHGHLNFKRPCDINTTLNLVGKFLPKNWHRRKQKRLREKEDKTITSLIKMSPKFFSLVV